MDKKKLSTQIFFGVVLLLSFLTFKIVQPYLSYLVISLVLSYSFYPMYKKVLKLTKYPSLAATLMIIFIFILIVLPIVFSILTIVENTQTLSIVVSADALDSVKTSANKFFGLELDLNDLITELFQKINSYVISNAAKFASGVVEIFIGFFILFVSMYYLFKQGPQITQKIIEYVPLKKEYQEGMKNEIKTVTYAVIYSEILVSIVQGTLVGISFYIFGLSNPIFWGFLSMLFAFMPVIGAYFVWIPASIILLLQGQFGYAIGLALFNLLLTSNIDNLMRPRLVSHRSRLHPFLTIIGIFGGVKFLGFIGLILGPMIISLFIVLLGYFNREFMN